MSWRKNAYRRDLVERHGQEAGLPLFQTQNEPVPKHIRLRINRAPKAMELATETRKLAHMTLKYDELNLGDKQQRVLDTMYLRDNWTNSELAQKLEWSINRITGRVFELRQIGLVITAEKRVCDVTGMIVQSWRVK